MAELHGSPEGGRVKNALNRRHDVNDFRVRRAQHNSGARVIRTETRSKKQNEKLAKTR